MFRQAHSIPAFFLTILFSVAAIATQANDDLQINEVCASNSSIITDDFGEHDDWIEIYNSGDEPALLNGLHFIIIEGDDEDLHPIVDPEEVLIVEPGEYLLLWADGQPGQGARHLDFRISSDGAEIQLLTEDMAPIDEISFDFMQADVSKGRVPEEEEWLFYDNPTPGAVNGDTGFLGQLSPPYYLGAPAFISEPTMLEIHHPDQEANIYYTLNGDDPSEDGILYITAIEVSPGDVVKAHATRSDYLPSYTSSRTFIEPEGLTLDIVSISAEESDIWGPDGIYSNPYQNIEKPVNLEYYTPDGMLQLAQNAGLKIHGPDGRSQKSLRLYARSEYGDNTFSYPFFLQKDLAEHKRIVLRNAGNDGLELNKTGIRDPLIHELFYSMNPENNPIAGFRPVHLYLNGSYWGIYNLRERQDRFYVENNYGDTDIDLLERTAHTASTWYAIEGTFDDFYLMEETAIELDLSEDENYEIITDWIDIENFVDYQLTEIYIINQDWLSNNMKMWRPQDGSAKWRWILWDTDWGLGLFYPNYPHGYPDWNALNFALSDWGGWNNTVNTELLQNLVENEDFVWYFSSRGADLMNSYLKPEVVHGKLEDIENMMAPDIQEQFDRWGGSVSNWEGKLDYVESFVEDRPFYCREHFIDRFDLIGTHEITLARTPDEGGYIEVNTIEANTNPWSGLYYEALEVRLKAVPNPGYEFVGWEGIDQESDEIWVDLISDSTFTANFEYIAGQTPQLVINEFNYHSGGADPGEWVEIFNPGPDTANLNEWKFSDGSQNFFNFGEDLVLEADSFLILCQDTMAFQQVYPDVNRIYGEFNFNLSNSGESPQLISPYEEIIDIVEYSDSAPWPTSPDGNGPTLELTSPDLDNNAADNWFARNVALGSPGEHNIYDNVEENESLDFLARGFPNPTSGDYNLVVDLKKPQIIDIAVYDLFGRKVKEVAKDKSLASGVHSFKWNSRADDGSEVPAGLYHLVVLAENGKRALRVVVTR